MLKIISYGFKPSIPFQNITFLALFQENFRLCLPYLYFGLELAGTRALVCKMCGKTSDVPEVILQTRKIH